MNASHRGIPSAELIPAAGSRFAVGRGNSIEHTTTVTQKRRSLLYVAQIPLREGGNDRIGRTAARPMLSKSYATALAVGQCDLKQDYAVSMRHERPSNRGPTRELSHRLGPDNTSAKPVFRIRSLRLPDQRRLPGVGERARPCIAPESGPVPFPASGSRFLSNPDRRAQARTDGQ